MVVPRPVGSVRRLPGETGEDFEADRPFGAEDVTHRGVVVAVFVDGKSVEGIPGAAEMDIVVDFAEGNVVGSDNDQWHHARNVAVGTEDGDSAGVGADSAGAGGNYSGDCIAESAVAATQKTEDVAVGASAGCNAVDCGAAACGKK